LFFFHDFSLFVKTNYPFFSIGFFVKVFQWFFSDKTKKPLKFKFEENV